MTAITPGDFLPCYDKQTNDLVQFSVKRSLEFSKDEVQSGNEATPSSPGEFYSYQRLFASLTYYYPKMLLISEPGTGKSITFIEAAENSKRSGIIKRLIILESSPNIHKDVTKQLMTKAVKPDMYAGEKARREDEPTSFHKMMTYARLKSVVDKLSDEEVIEKFSGTFIVADEAHSLTMQDGLPSGVFSGLKRIVDVAKGVRLLLVSATIMTNSPLQVIPISELLLPPERQFSDSEKKIMTDNKLSPEITDIVYNRFKGYTSYISANTETAEPVFVVRPWNDASNVSVTRCNSANSIYYTQLSEQQGRVYSKYAPGTPESIKDTYYMKGRQSSTFVFPDGSISGTVSSADKGDDDVLSDDLGRGISKYVEQWKPPSTTKGGGASKGRYKLRKSTAMSSTLGIKVVKGEDGKSKTVGDKDYSELYKLSSKFSEIIKIERESFVNFVRATKGLNKKKGPGVPDEERQRLLMTKSKEAGTTFVYSEFKNGSGAILLSAIFEAYGFVDYRKGGPAINVREIPKFALLTPEAGDDIETVRNVFNSKENVDGSIIRVIIVSKALRDGINLAHAIRAHILLPTWTEASEKQAMYRVIRADSHDGLRKYRQALGDNDKIQIKIYKHASYYSSARDGGAMDINQSVDYLVYKNLYEKEEQIKLVSDGLKKAALDYFLTRKRNNQPWNNFPLFNETEANSPAPHVSITNYNSEFAYQSSDLPKALGEISTANSTEELWSILSSRSEADPKNRYVDRFALIKMEERGLKCIKGGGFVSSIGNKQGIPFISNRAGRCDYDDYYYKTNVYGNVKRDFMDAEGSLYMKSDAELLASLSATGEEGNEFAEVFERLGSIKSINNYFETNFINMILGPDSPSSKSFSILYSPSELNFSSYIRLSTVKKIRDEAVLHDRRVITKDNVERYIVPGFTNTATVYINLLLTYSNGVEVFGDYSDRSRFVNRRRLVRILPVEKKASDAKYKGVLEWRYVQEGPEAAVLSSLFKKDDKRGGGGGGPMVVKKSPKKQRDDATVVVPEVVVDESHSLFGRMDAGGVNFRIVDRRNVDTTTGRICTTWSSEELNEFVEYAKNKYAEGLNNSEFVELVEGKKLSSTNRSLVDTIGITGYIKTKPKKCEFIKKVFKHYKLIEII